MGFVLLPCSCWLLGTHTGILTTRHYPAVSHKYSFSVKRDALIYFGNGPPPAGRPLGKRRKALRGTHLSEPGGVRQDARTRPGRRAFRAGTWSGRESGGVRGAASGKEVNSGSVRCSFHGNRTGCGGDTGLAGVGCTWVWRPPHSCPRTSWRPGRGQRARGRRTATRGGRP